MTRENKLSILAFVLAATSWITPWSRELFVGDETKYSQIIREMRATGSFFVPLLEGRPYSHKPPLHFWLMDLLTFPFGTHSLWPFVLPSLISFIALLFLCRRLAAELFGERARAWMSFFVATFLMMWGLAQTARMDVMFTLLISLAALYIFRFLSHERPGDLLRAAVAGGLGIMVKGPMAAVMLLLLLVFETVRRRRAPAGSYWLAFGILAAIPLAWAIPAALGGGGTFARELLVEQNIGRAIGSFTHREPPWFYLLRFPLTFLPWGLMLFVAAIAMFRRTADESHHPLRFCASWILAVVIPFSIISGKLDVYMLPAFVPAALILSWFMISQPRDAWSLRATVANRILLALFSVVFIAALYAAPGFLELPERQALSRPSMQGLFWATSAVAVAGLILSFLRPPPARLETSVIALGIATLAPLWYVGLLLMPLVNENASGLPLVRSMAGLTTAGSDVALFRCPHLWARNMPPRLDHVRMIGSLEGVDPPPRILATSGKYENQLGKELTRYEKIGDVRLKGKQFNIYRRR